ncbi:zinc-binding alcohol dehydrogenase family protein [Corynebacterium bovis]|uniref:zinc-binding alcohol dehydrogenase family protein n=1 Tax=Corynebacterium bovis TaxID=36808 RepID=UPI003D7258C1
MAPMSDSEATTADTATRPTAAPDVPATMRAVGITDSLPVDDPACLVDVEVPVPTPGDHDLLVEIEAISVNPIDTKVRRRADRQPDGRPKILGYDAVGTVRATGDATSRFQPGDRVFYAGDIRRPGTNAQFHVVDERLVGRAPTEISAVDAAALPLTSLTAWESLFDRMGANVDSNGTLLVLGGAGGVPSVLIQLARALTGLTVIATASREESEDWVLEMGAHDVVNHRRDLVDQVREIDPDGVDLVFSSWTTGRERELAEIMTPHGHLVLIDDPEGLDITPFKQKSVAVHWESMFTRSSFGTADMEDQGLALDRVADMIDDGRLSTTANLHLRGLSAETLREAHRRVEDGRLTGKLVVEF